MKMKIEITKKLVSDTGRSFSVGQDIAFTYDGKTKYIGEIVDMHDNKLEIKDIEINSRAIADRSSVQLFDFDRMSDCSYVTYN